ncbi:ISAs1 family transposase [Streptomyces sp. NPDC002817]|uniref:ISAs1 family transposase n=1 Tax=Streptomyces sp. NPDC088357 TaxID=3154655 RepID=UPI0034253B53
MCLVKSPSRQHRVIGNLPSRLAALPDPPDRRGRRHPFVSVLLMACSAVMCGARSFAAIGQWPRNAPQDTLARLGARRVSAFAVRVAPSTATFRRIINQVWPGGLADLLGCDPSGADTLAVDGKSARGSRHGDIPAADLLAAMTGRGLTVTQLRGPGKTNEITCFAGLLTPFDLSGVTVTADALHAQGGHARFLVEDKKAHYALCVKKNQAGRCERLHMLPWKEVTAKFYDRSEGHGRKKCSKCHHTERGNRASQARFTCRSYGFVEHADHNASPNIRQRGWMQWVCGAQPTAPALTLIA